MEKSKPRNSNLELMRIVAMLVIIAHHYVVNSGFIPQCFDTTNVTWNMYFLQCMGFGGKMAINAFVLLSAYFMCKQRLEWKRVLKLYLEILFYAIIVDAILILFGKETFSLNRIYMSILYPFVGYEKGFVGGFFAFYLFIPFLNRSLQVLNQKIHFRLILLLLFTYTIVSTFLLNERSWSYLGWYITLYYIASYIRLYPNKYTESKKVASWMFFGSVILIWISIAILNSSSRFFYYFLCSDSQKLLALTCGLGMFLFFKNISIKKSKFINTIATTTFGVLLIHAHSDAMRTWLWQDTLQNVSYYNSSWLPIHFIFSILAVYIICVVIDYLRIVLIERPLFKKIDSLKWVHKECFVE